MYVRIILASVVILVAGCQEAPQSPYAGQETREVKSLSDAEIKDLLDGAGMGYAKVAELNGFPGPKHVLELADELDLDEEQRTQTSELFARMKEQAVTLGRDLIEVEKTLDETFASGSVSSDEARTAMKRAAELDAEIRWTHVSAHLDQTEILTQEQRHAYIQLRGYASGHEHSGHQGHGS